MKNKGFILMTVLIIVILVPIVVFGITFFITSSLSRSDAQTRRMQALYLAESGIQKGIFNLKSTGAALPVADLDTNNKISLTQVASGCGIYQLKCTGTSVAQANSISRTVFAQYELATNKVQIYMEGDGTGIPVPPTGGGLIYQWNMDEGSGWWTGTGDFRAFFLLGYLFGITQWVQEDEPGDWQIRFGLRWMDSFAYVSDQDALDLSSSGVIEAKVKFNDPDPRYSGIVHKGRWWDANDEDYGIMLENGKLILQLRNTGGHLITLNSNFKPDSNKWYLVRGDWNASGMRIYVDGVLKNSNTTAVTVRKTQGPLQFGTVPEAWSGQQSLTIDDVKISAGC